jgi:segregation and condensation protein B
VSDPTGEQAPPLSAVLEAVLLVTDEPVPATTLAQVVERPTAEVEQGLRGLAEDYAEAGRGFELRLVAGGWRLYTRPDCAPYVERFVLDGQQARLTQAALETLAVIAYRQPVTRARVSAVRGVNVDGVVRTLLARGLIADAGQDPDSAGTLYRTTPLFLERLGLQSLDELPPLAPLLPELSELDDDSATERTR